MELQSSQTVQNLKDAFAGESQANRRYLYFAAKADVEGENGTFKLLLYFTQRTGVGDVTRPNSKRNNEASFILKETRMALQT